MFQTIKNLQSSLKFPLNLWKPIENPQYSTSFSTFPSLSHSSQTFPHNFLWKICQRKKSFPVSSTSRPTFNDSPHSFKCSQVRRPFAVYWDCAWTQFPTPRIARKNFSSLFFVVCCCCPRFGRPAGWYSPSRCCWMRELAGRLEAGLGEMCVLGQDFPRRIFRMREQTKFSCRLASEKASRRLLGGVVCVRVTVCERWQDDQESDLWLIESWSLFIVCYKELFVSMLEIAGS